MSDSPPLDAYRQELTSWAEAMTRCHNDAVYAALAPGFRPEQVDLFTDGNLDKRLEKLSVQLEFVAGAFADFEGLMDEYVSAQPLAAYDTGSGDGERFLSWLERCRRLTPEQRDFVACQRARYAVEEAARKNRRGHVRFQELWSVAGELAAELDSNPELCVYLNPIRARARFQTAALLEGQGSPPADALFFTVGTSVRTAILEPRALALVNGLARVSPCTVAQWLWVSKHWGREDFVQFCRELAELGLVAIG
jgi:hypothetical protein